MKYAIGFVLVFVVYIGISSALTCYQCTQPKGQGLACETNVETVQQVVCPEGNNTCINYVWTTTGSSVISRHCAPLNHCEQLSLNSTSFNNLELCKSCDVDLCNSGFIFKATVIWTLVVPVAAKILF